MSTNFSDCFFLQASSGDQGVHDGSGVWWISPDVRLFDPLHEFDANGQYLYQDTPAPGIQYHWAVSVNRKASCTSLPPDLMVCAEMWIGFPGLFFQPNVNCVQLNQAVCAMPQSFEGSDWTWVSKVNWTPANMPSDKDGPGHRCLMARCYVQGQTPPDLIPSDPKVAQHNLDIQEVTQQSQMLTLPISTTSPRRGANEGATVRVVADLKPAERTLKAIMPSLQRTKGFQRIAGTAPRQFGLDPSGIPDAKVSDNTRVGCLGGLFASKRQPTYEVRGRLKPDEDNQLRLTADLSQSQKGDAHIFHVTQSGADGRPQGGLTVVAVMV